MQYPLLLLMVALPQSRPRTCQVCERIADRLGPPDSQQHLLLLWTQCQAKCWLEVLCLGPPLYDILFLHQQGGRCQQFPAGRTMRQVEQSHKGKEQ